MFGFGIGSVTNKETVLKIIEKNPGIETWDLCRRTTHKAPSRVSDNRKEGYDIRVLRVYKNGKATNSFRHFLLPQQKKQYESFLRGEW